MKKKSFSPLSVFVVSRKTWVSVLNIIIVFRVLLLYQKPEWNIFIICGNQDGNFIERKYVLKLP